MTTDIAFKSINRDELDHVLAAGRDHGDNEIVPFTDDAGGWPLRCCLADAVAGDQLALIAWSPFSWTGPYREVGPIVVHHDDCRRLPDLEALPAALDARAVVLRPYTHDRRIAYGHVRHRSTGGSVTEAVREVLEHVDVDVVHGRNVVGGCFSFLAARSSTAG